MKGRLSDGRAKPRKDVWLVISVVILALYALFMIYPLFMLLRNAVIDSGGQFTLDYFVKFLSKQYYLGTVLNSFKVSISATILTMVIGVPLAYFYNMYEIKGARFLQIIIILCSMSAPFIGAYSWILLLGRNGLITNFVKDLTGIKLPSIYGFGGILLALSTKELQEIRGKEISMIFQEPMTSLNPVFTIGRQIMESLLFHGEKDKKRARERAIEMLRLVGIPDPEKSMERYPHQISGGMRQRVMIAIALACEPKLLIADEPTTALDVTIQAQILELMQELRKKLGMSIIMITHDLGVVASMCEKIAVMYAGHIVEYGTTDEIFYQPGHEYTKGLINSIPKLNTAEHERLVPIEGTPVDLLNPPAGCPFAPRCKNCMKICLSKMPPRTELSDTHYTYCWLQQKAAFEKGEKAE